jgi:hypothetical protein
MLEDLEVQDPDVVPSPPGGGGHQFDAERLQTQEDLRVHEPARMAAQNLHAFPSLR